MNIKTTLYYSIAYLIFLLALFCIATYNKSHMTITHIDPSTLREIGKDDPGFSPPNDSDQALARHTYSHQIISNTNQTNLNQEWFSPPTGWLNTPTTSVAMGYLIVELEQTNLSHQAISDLALDLNARILGIYSPLNWVQLEVNFSSPDELDAIIKSWQDHPSIRSVVIDTKIM
ncbi:hypothetical protein ACP3V3_16915 [Vibrio sp. PNB22_3_1]